MCEYFESPRRRCLVSAQSRRSTAVMSHRLVAVCLSTEQFGKRRRTALWYTVSLLFLAVVILVVGLVSATRTGNVPVAGYYPGIIVSWSPSSYCSPLHLHTSASVCKKALFY